jgi:HlyD family secretion protein
MRRAPAFGGVLLTLAAAVAGAILARPAAAIPAAPRPALTVTLVTPVEANWPRVIEAGGGLYAWQEGVVAAETGGLRVVEVAVEVGDQVRRGQELVRLADETVRAELAQEEARVAQVRASLAEARANADRARTVKDRGAMSEQQSTQYLVGEETAKANLAAAEAALEMQRLRLAQTRILAVDDGVVSSRSATLGMVVQAGTELLRIVRQGRVEWRAEVTAEQLAQVRTGQEAELRLPSGETIVGQVRAQAPTLDPGTRYGLVYVDVPVGSPARAGMFARGTVRLGIAKVLTLPESAVVLRDGASHVYQVRQGDRVDQLRVEVGRRAEGRVEILTGLESGARVVETGGAFLNDGDPVRVEASAPPGAPAGVGAEGGTSRLPAGVDRQ